MGSIAAGGLFGDGGDGGDGLDDNYRREDLDVFDGGGNGRGRAVPLPASSSSSGAVGVRYSSYSLGEDEQRVGPLWPGVEVRLEESHFIPRAGGGGESGCAGATSDDNNNYNNSSSSNSNSNSNNAPSTARKRREVTVRTPWQCTGYVHNNSLVQQSGCYRTCDVGRLLDANDGGVLDDNGDVLDDNGGAKRSRGELVLGPRIRPPVTRTVARGGREGDGDGDEDGERQEFTVLVFPDQLEACLVDHAHHLCICVFVCLCV